MDITMLINELSHRGITARFETVTKQGHDLDALIIDTDTPIIPVFYLRDYQSVNEATAADAIAWRIQQSNVMSAQINTDDIKNPDYVLANCRIGLIPTYKAGKMINRPSEFRGISEHVYYTVNAHNGAGSITVTDDVLDVIGLDANEVWLHAYENTLASSVIVDMIDVLPQQLGVSAPPTEATPFTMAIVSNEDTCSGAGCILNKAMLNEYAEHIGAKRLILIPSSIHEWIVIPYADDMNIDEINGVVRNVNSTIDTKDFLSNESFIYDCPTD